MKKAAILFFLLIFARQSHAQDIILKNNTEEIQAKIEEISDTEIRYRLWNQQNGPLRTIRISEVFRITYQDGMTETFGSRPKSANEQTLSGKTYNIGDIYDENGVKGIVIYVTDEGRHGLIAHAKSPAARSSSNTKAWCKKELSSESIGATDENDGMQNMLAVEEYIAAHGLDWDSFPAFKRCLEFGPGWYLPAIKEVEYLIRAINYGHLGKWDDGGLYEFNELILKAGGSRKDKLDIPGFTERFMSSTESGNDMIFHYLTDGVNFFGITSKNYMMIKRSETYKKNAHIDDVIRPVHKF